MAEITTPISGLHCVLHRMTDATTDPATTTAIAELTAIGDLEVTREMADYHTYQDEWQHKVATTLSVSDLEFESVFLGSDADQVALEAQVTSGTKTHFAITYGTKGDYDNGKISRFQAFVSSWARMAPLDDKVMVKFTLSVDGGVTHATLS